MNETIQKILSHYQSDNPGTRANLVRLLSHGRLAGTGKLVILPVDQGFEHGPARSFGMNPPATIRSIMPSLPSIRVAVPMRLHWDFSKPSPRGTRVSFR